MNIALTHSELKQLTHSVLQSAGKLQPNSANWRFFFRKLKHTHTHKYKQKRQMIVVFLSSGRCSCVECLWAILMVNDWCEELNPQSDDMNQTSFCFIKVRIKHAPKNPQKTERLEDLTPLAKLRKSNRHTRKNTLYLEPCHVHLIAFKYSAQLFFVAQGKVTSEFSSARGNNSLLPKRTWKYGVRVFTSKEETAKTQTSYSGTVFGVCVEAGERRSNRCA